MSHMNASIIRFVKDSLLSWKTVLSVSFIYLPHKSER